MNNKEAKVAAPVQELTDEELKNVAGGQTYFNTNCGYFKYVGKSDAEKDYKYDWDRRYLCPNCGKPVHYGKGARFYCDLCNESWYCESKLYLNLRSGLYAEISEAEYKKGKSWWQ